MTTTVVSVGTTTIRVIVKGGGVDVSVLVEVVRVTVETVAAVRRVSTGGVYLMYEAQKAMSSGEVSSLVGSSGTGIGSEQTPGLEAFDAM